MGTYGIAEKRLEIRHLAGEGNPMVPLTATPALTRSAGAMALHVECPGSSGGSFGP